ncbi:ABC-type sugar transport system periplasmic component-like protein [Alkaliphilus metalliredigens QYMF]|uniref:ABC-type sugar transport system periplasmic component-like protein n=1 Tax=Alkaliphilus metalliredigens (strain QYMF) TaxID=293826 RepID=A6TKU8_ALKMQ|nr:sugar ABC transporter substrate-binding protein [Alkaliphilus metalliredigens]ABR46816.1 ABC-type sugar transport system periplasmic component-like protein [Alkaliphilus metalliredigens QYMF]
MKKKLIVLLAITLIMAMLAGCTSPANNGAGGDENGETVYRVAYVARTQSDSFAAWLANAISEEADKYDNIIIDVFDGQASDSTQNSLIENAITSNYDAIIIQPNNGEAQKSYAEQAVAAGIITITTNARIEGVQGASSVDADPYEQAKVNADVALEQIPQNANVVVLKGPPGNFHADARRDSWQKEFFDKRPDVTIVGEEIANWNKDEAMTYMETWVQANSKIDAIIAMNDNMAAGALEVVRDDSNFAGMLSYGVDGTAEAVLLIQEGVMTQTSLQSAYDLATALLDTSNKLLTGAETQIDIDIDAPVINSDNVEEYVEMHKRAGAIR